jgi:tRNA pseudouridine55 synthase
MIEQMPPPFSAKKIHGVPAYKLARRHKPVVLQPVQVKVEEFAILEVEGAHARFRARVASGTYMRSIAHDMGQRLGCGAHLESLRRTAVAEFTIADAHTVEQFEGIAAESGAAASGVLAEFFVHPRQLLPQMPSVTADESTAGRIRSGRTVNLPDHSRARQVKVFQGQRELIAIADRIAGTLFHPRIVFVAEEAGQLTR